MIFCRMFLVEQSPIDLLIDTVSAGFGGNPKMKATP